MKIVCNSSVLITLDNAGILNILKVLFKEILIMFLIPHSLAVGFPLVPSPWGEGEGEGDKNSTIPFHTPTACGGVIDSKGCTKRGIWQEEDASVCQVS